MKNKKQIFTAILSVLVSVFLVAGFAFAVTTIGTNIDTDGNLTVDGIIILGSGATIDNITPGAITFSDKLVLAPIFNAADASNQAVEADATLGADFGTSTALSTRHGGAVMGNIWGTNLTKKYNYIGGVIGKYSIDGTNASTYPVGAVLGGIGDGTTTADGAFVAYIDGDSGAHTAAGAAFKAMNLTSTPGVPGFSYGLDLYYDSADPNYLPLAFGNADIRLSSGVVIMTGAASPNGSVTAPKGSLYIETGTPLLWMNTDAGTTWQKVGAQ